MRAMVMMIVAVRIVMTVRVRMAQSDRSDLYLDPKKLGRHVDDERADVPADVQ